MSQRMKKDTVHGDTNDIYSSTEQHTDEQLRALKGEGPIVNQHGVFGELWNESPHPLKEGQS